MSVGAGLLCGENAVGAATAAEIENAVAADVPSDLRQRSRSVIETAIGENAGTRHKAARGTAGDAGLKRHFMAAARPLALALAPQHRLAS